ncbi:MAG TPA: PPC domain-containing protein, partial [Pirellulales bacterium]
VDLKQGQRLSVVVEGLRLGRAMFDPRIAIFDSAGKQIALCDDHPLVRQDSIVALMAPADGRYTIQLRDSAYNGNDNFNYRLHVGTFPQPTAVFPLGGKAGEEIEFHFLGDVRGDFTQKVRLPETADSEFVLFPHDDEGTAAAGIPVRINDLPNYLEPQAAAADTQIAISTESQPKPSQPKSLPPVHATVKDALPVETPSAINGIISSPKEVDFYRFKAKKGEVLDINCYARRLRSPLDSVVQIFRINPNGNAPQVAANDDAAGPDSYLRFTAPDDGEYAVSVKDQLGKGGPTFTYRLELAHVASNMIVQIPKVQQFSQDRQTIVVPRGNRYVARVGVDRKDFGGDVVISASDLPEGVTLGDETIAGAVPSAPVLFEADPDAPVGGALAVLSGRLADPKQTVPSQYRQNTELVIGDNQNPYWSYTARRLAVVVTEEAPFTLELIEPKVPIVQNGSLQLKVVAYRDPDFKAPIALELIHSAPGVTNGANVTIPEGKSEAYIPLNANGKPGNGNWKMAVLGKAQVKGGDVYVSTQLATLQVASAFVQFTMNRAAGEQGQTAEIVCKLQQTTPFEGTAKVHLVGLPNKATAPELEFTKETQQLTFPVAIDPQSPVGRHKGIGCQAIIVQNDEPICHNFSGIELRIDPASAKKPEKKPDAVASAAGSSASPAVDNAKAAAPSMSRLEKLRVEAQQKGADK